MNTAPLKTREVEVAGLRKAIEIERRARFPDFQGKRQTFSQFMCQTAGRLCHRYPVETRWATIRGLFRQYPNMDVASRISILRRAEKLLDDRTSRDMPPPEVKIPDGPGDSPHLPAQAKSSPEDARMVAKVKPRSLAPPRETDVQFVKGVGPKNAELLNNLGIYTVEDLLRHYPRQHLDFNDKVNISSLECGQEVTILGKIRSVGAFQSRRGNVYVMTIVIYDGTGVITVTRFIGGKGNKYLLERLKAQFPKGAQVMASGVVELDRFGSRLQLKNAEIEVLGEIAEDTEELKTLHTGRLVPVYPLTEGLGLRYLRTAINNALELYKGRIEDLVPEKIRQEYFLVELESAIRDIHFPDNLEARDSAHRTIVFEELFMIQVQLAYRRHQSMKLAAGARFAYRAGGLVDRLIKELPFELTGAQRRVFQEIASDLASDRPMQRLVQGDVGSGKTIVAVLALLVAIENGFQGAIMAPTEILAEQHYRQFQKLLTSLGLKVAFFVGKQGVKQRRELQQELLSGQVHVAVGTHALIQDGIEFKKLGLTIIDEQHRFGVKQRAALKAKGKNPELLTMTATPIPRTLALTLHGDLDISEIDEMPPGRKPVQTELFAPGKKRTVWKLVKDEVAKGRQAYIVFPLIEESETLSAKAATVEYEKLRLGVFKDLNVGLMHGRLKQADKDEIMESFRAREIDVLVSTTVIEVGVDVPNATVMVIENADRFGLSQLHQLRGRVGRGAEQSYCFLIAGIKSETTRQRLGIMTETNDGFVVAEKDLEIRGPGEFLGVRQSGIPEILLADLVRDAKVLEQARKAAIEVVRADPELKEHPRLRQKVVEALSDTGSDLLGSG